MNFLWLLNVPFDSLGVSNSLAGRTSIGVIWKLHNFLFALAFNLICFIFQLVVVVLLLLLLLIIEEVLIRRAWRVRGGQDGWWKQGDPREHYFIREHGHELFIIKLVKLVLIVVVILSTLHWWIQVGDGIAHRPPVNAAPGRGEVEKLIHPRRVLIVLMIVVGDGAVVIKRWQLHLLLVWREIWPTWWHVWDLWR